MAGGSPAGFFEAAYSDRQAARLSLLFPFAALWTEAVADLADDFDQEVYFSGCVVEIEAGAGAGGDAEAIVEGPGAVVAGADGDALLV